MPLLDALDKVPSADVVKVLAAIVRRRGGKTGQAEETKPAPEVNPALLNLFGQIVRP